MATQTGGPVVAAVDVGSNSIKMTVARRAPDGSLDMLNAASETIRLGTGVSATGRLADDRIAAALTTLRAFAATARALGAVRLVGVATEATRTASNGAAFLDQVQNEIGWDLVAISGDEEAALTFRGLGLEIDLAGTVVVADIGGGSTEIIVAEAGEVQFARSLVLGSGTLTEQYVPSDPPAPSELDAVTAVAVERIGALPIPVPGMARLVVIGGTGEYLERLVPLPDRIVSVDVLAALRTCLNMTSAELAGMIGIQQARARVLPAGIAIVRGLTDLLEPVRIQAAQSGIRTGLLLAEFDALVGKQGAG